MGRVGQGVHRLHVGDRLHLVEGGEAPASDGGGAGSGAGAGASVTGVREGHPNDARVVGLDPGRGEGGALGLPAGPLGVGAGPGLGAGLGALGGPGGAELGPAGAGVPVAGPLEPGQGEARPARPRRPPGGQPPEVGEGEAGDHQGHQDPGGGDDGGTHGVQLAAQQLPEDQAHNLAGAVGQGVGVGQGEVGEDGPRSISAP